ncbi:MAG: SPOR domain-containing protein [Deltaproteobacteria bacterium]|nr:SPOR domain-containing protein [Deltaproteobacteria bacterium]
MRGFVVLAAISVLCICFCSGCSRQEEPPPPAPKPKVVKRIIKPPPQETPPAAPQREEQIETASGKESGTSVAPRQQETASEVVKTSGDRPAGERKEVGVYVTRPGDSLGGIAAKEEVYGDPLKWPILYRVNRDKLEAPTGGAAFPRREVSPGVRLKIITPEEATENLKKDRGRLWVVNVLSSTTDERIVPAVIVLVREGYPVYLTRVRVKGEDWMRLRVGFFQSRKEAEEEGRKIMNLLKFKDSWTTKAEEEEFREYAGYS